MIKINDDKFENFFFKIKNEIVSRKISKLEYILYYIIFVFIVFIIE
jgi:hypothetical protein